MAQMVLLLMSIKGYKSVTSLLTRPLLPNEPRIANELVEQELTDRYLMPALAELETYFLSIRAEVDAILQPQQPIKLGKPYPLGQCLEITQAVQKRLQRRDALSHDDEAAIGHAALSAFLRAGGALRRVWGDLRGQFFQNAFQIGTLYVDVSNDTVVPTKPKVEILPFAKSELTPIQDYRHFKRIAERYWQHQVFPNHVLPELAPFCPLVHVSPLGQVRLYDPTQYMIAMTRSTGFQASEEVLREPAMPANLFAFVSENLQSIKLEIACTPEQGRAEALNHCRIYRAKRWHTSDREKDIMVNIAHGVNRRLAKVIMHIPRVSSTQNAAKSKGAEILESGLPQLPAASSYAAVSKGRHADKRWQRHFSYHFAAYDTVAPVTAQELPQAMMALPIGFIASSAAFDLVAVQSLTLGRNAFIATDGRWLAGYLPAVYRSYPFTLVSAEHGQQVLCIDENSGLVTDDPKGERFFNDDGNPSQTVKDVLTSLTQHQAHRNVTANICAVLEKHKLIQPWPIELQAEGKTQTIEGLHRIDEAALNALPPDAFIELRDSGALAAAYCQLLSMQHIQKLERPT